MCICVCIYIYIYIYISLSISLSLSIYIYIYIYIYIDLRTCRPSAARGAAPGLAARIRLRRPSDRNNKSSFVFIHRINIRAVPFVPIPLPEQVLQTSSCTILLYKFVIQNGLGMGMGINGTAHSNRNNRATE